MYGGYGNPYQYMAQPNRTPPVQMVSSMAEVQAARIEYDGNVNVFLCPAQQCILTKQIDFNTGGARILVYKLQDMQTPQYADVSAVNSLSQRVSMIENYLKGGNVNVQSNDAFTASTTQPKPNDGIAADNGQ